VHSSATRQRPLFAGHRDENAVTGADLPSYHPAIISRTSVRSKPQEYRDSRPSTTSVFSRSLDDRRGLLALNSGSPTSGSAISFCVVLWIASM